MWEICFCYFYLKCPFPVLLHIFTEEEQEQNNYDLKHPFPALLVLQFSLDPTSSSENLAHSYYEVLKMLVYTSE